MNRSIMKQRLERITHAYKTLSLIALNAFVVFCLLNLFAYVAGILLEKPAGERVIREHGMAKLQRAYPHMDALQIKDLHRETWGRSLVYEPLTEFREPASQGKYVNVSADGYRMHDKGGGWPPATNNMTIFVFGGSTTFGYGVADSETIPARIQTKIHKLKVGGRPVSVYNFGRGFYTSSQERILFEKLIQGGNLPQVAVFIDGINEPVFPSEHTELSVDLDNAVREKNGEVWNYGILRRLPIMALVAGQTKADRMQLAAAQEASLKRQLQDGADLNYDSASGVICRRYLDSIRMINAVSKEFRIRSLFVWQPAPLYNFDPARHPFGADPNHLALPHVYQRMNALRAKDNSSKSFLWLADIQAGRNEPLYVDSVHYSALFSDLIADEIVTRLQALGWLE